jgi:hypothetical protein
MRLLLLTAAFLAFPAIAYAHSGAVFNAVVNYFPVVVPILSGIYLACRKFLERHFPFSKKRD